MKNSIVELKVYLAWKIRKGCWRHKIFSWLRNTEPWWIVEQHYGKYYFTYTWPYFIGCDHGCYHWRNNHWVGANEDWVVIDWEPSRTKKQTVGACYSWVLQADVVFAWIDSMDCYWTLAELGYAQSLFTPVFFYYSDKLEEIDDLWFVQQYCKTAKLAHDANDAWKQFLVDLSITNRDV